MDLIEKSAFKKRISDVYENKNIYQMIDEMPTVDAVPVVRCEDCIYGTEMSGNIVCHQPKHNEYETDIHSFGWFCADGERKNTGDRKD